MGANLDLMGLQQEVEELLQFVYLLPVAVARLGPDGAVEMLNPKAVQLLQDLDIDSGHADGPAILDALSPGLGARWRASAGQIGPVGEPQRCSLQRWDGSPLHLLLQVVRPDARCTLLAIEDVTTTVEQERELGRQRRRLALALEHIQGYGVVMLGSDGCVNDWNPSLGRLLGLEAGSAIGRPLLDFVAGEALAPGDAVPASHFEALRDAVARQGWCELQAPWRRADGGDVLWGECVLTPLVEPDGSTSGFVAVIRDVTEDHRQRLRLEEEALTDPLTGLYNRRGLEKRCLAPGARESDAEGTPPGRGKAAVGPPAWIMLDIDHFKRVNDTHGHDGGDAVLKAVAAALQGAARAGDTLARVGGEEFVLHLPAANDVIARRVAERLRLHLQALTIDAGRHSVHITASFGVALQGEGEAWTQALERADAALYQAKHEGRNRVQMALPAGPATTLPI